MRRSAFAALIGVSKQMVSKYGPLIVERDGDVDAAASLAALEGRLDEDKRQAALKALGQVSAPAAAAAPLGPVAKSAKVQKDEVELQLKQLQLGREAGELVSVDEVDQAARHAVAALREAFGNRRRDMAEAICLQFGLAPDKASALARMLARQFEETLGVFGQAMAALAAPAPAPSPDAAPEAARATA